MLFSTADVVICGAGIAGISSAYHLSVKKGVKNVILVDERPPLSLTSDKSTECYRNFWPGPGDAMVSLINRSIDIMEDLAQESSNIFHLSRRGYVYATANPSRIKELELISKESAELGAGPLRYHGEGDSDLPYIPSTKLGFKNQPNGIDFILDRKIIQKYFPYLSTDVVALIHARRCGWFSVQQLGTYMLERSKEYGVKVLEAKVVGVEVKKEKIQAVNIKKGKDSLQISTNNFVNASGPFLKEVGRLIGVEIPVFCELHLKMAFKDYLKIIPRDAPMLIWSDPVLLSWSEEEKEILAESENSKKLLELLPPGVHLRPEGGDDSDIVIGNWAYHTPPVEPIFPFPIDPQYPEIVLRGLVKMIPRLEEYLTHLPKASIDGGYYTKTKENRPLIGKLPIQGSYIIGALSGFGVMAACGAGELLADHVCGNKLPHYAPAFSIERYEHPEYQKLLEYWENTGQL